MKKGRLKEFIAIIILFLSVFSIGISFASVVQQVQDNSGSISNSKWEVKFDNLSEPILSGTAVVTIAPELTATKLDSYTVTLTKPGDSVTYTFDIVNNGTTAAILTSLTKLNPTCTGTTSADGTVVCGNLTYSLTYTGGEEVKEEDVINAHETKNVTLTVTYNKEAQALSTSSVLVSNLDIAMIFTQA